MTVDCCRLQVSLPPQWPVDCATLTNYRYDTVDDHYSLSEPVLLLDRHGRPLRPGSGSHNGDPFFHYRIGDYLDAQDAMEDDLSATLPGSGLHEPDHGGTTVWARFRIGGDGSVDGTNGENKITKARFLSCRAAVRHLDTVPWSDLCRGHAEHSCLSVFPIFTVRCHTASAPLL